MQEDQVPTGAAPQAAPQAPDAAAAPGAVNAPEAATAAPAAEAAAGLQAVGQDLTSSGADSPVADAAPAEPKGEPSQVIQDALKDLPPVDASSAQGQAVVMSSPDAPSAAPVPAAAPEAAAPPAEAAPAPAPEAAQPPSETAL